MSTAATVVRSSATAAFAVRLSGEMVAWNRGAERLFGLSPEQAIGKTCFQLLRGRDAFGNSYCIASCPVLEMVRRQKPIHPFEVIYRDADGNDLPVTVSVFVLPPTGCEERALVHLLHRTHLADLVGDCDEADQDRGPKDLIHRLTPRQIEVLRLLAAGLNTHAIAERLCISEITVRNHVENLLQKLEVHSRLEAASVAHRSGLA